MSNSREQVAFLFDLDGTLLDSGKLIADTANCVRFEKGFQKLDESELVSKIGLPAKVLFEDLELTEIDLDIVVAEFRMKFQYANPADTKIFPGALNFLKISKELGISISTATTRPTEMAKFQLSEMGLTDCFDLIQGTDDFPPKPAPDVILRAMGILGATDVFMFGDREEDMQAAVLAGATAIGLEQTSHDNARLTEAGAHKVFKSFLEIPNPQEFLKYFY